VATTTTTVLVPHNNNSTIITAAPPEQIDRGLTVKALPNPTSGSFAFTVSSDITDNRILVTVFDIYGRKIEDKWLTNGGTIHLGDMYKAGTYLLRVVQGMERKELKLVKMK
jgi:hypothetical protein